MAAYGRALFYRARNRYARPTVRICYGREPTKLGGEVPAVSDVVDRKYEQYHTFKSTIRWYLLWVALHYYYGIIYIERF